MKKNFLFGLLALMLAGFGFGGVSMADDCTAETATSENSEAEINSHYYCTLEAAVAAAQDGETITLLSNVTLANDAHLNLAKKVTIDGQNYSIVAHTTEASSDGVINLNAGSEGSMIKDLTINFTSAGRDTSAIAINGGFDGTSKDTTVINNVTINGGETIGEEIGILSHYDVKGTIEIKGNALNNLKYGMYLNGITNATIEGNTIDSTNYNAINVAGDNSAYPISNVIIKNNTLTNISKANYGNDVYSAGIRIGENTSDITIEGNNISMLNDKLEVYYEGKNRVQFNSNGGTTIAEQFIENGGTVQKPVDPTRSDYTFNGWYSDEALTTAYDFSTSVTENVTLYAKWTAKSSGSSSSGGGGSRTSTTKADDAKATTGDTTNLDETKTDETKTDETKNDGDNNEGNNNDGNNNGTTPNEYTQELIDAYQFAYEKGITTKESIEEAEMFEPLTRIAMAKMLSQYAINVLGKTPDTTIEVPNFPDVSEELDAQYNNGVTLAYQLGIMGINVEKFRPNDLVTRAEFGTALSRMLFGIADGEGNEYYSTHLQKLMEEKIITNDNPNLQELRGYVMIMLMRSAQ